MPYWLLSQLDSLSTSRRVGGGMYDVGDCLPVENVPDGTNLLVAGPPMTGKYELITSILCDGTRRGEVPLWISTKHDADRIRQDAAKRLGEETDAPIGVVDCVSRERGEETTDDELTKFVSAPGDLTGIGMASSELIERIVGNGNQVRLGLHSISQLLMYVDAQTAFRFLHILTGRIGTANALGFGVLDTETHDKQTVTTLSQLFDGTVETRREDGEAQVRVVGVEGATGDWVPQ
jgi:KaiC/GvpD/RAD55 family RecA-like ATPase